MFWWLQTQFWERGGLSEGDVLFTFWLFCSHHLSCSQASQEFRAVLGLAESNLINSSSRQSSSIRQEPLVSTTLQHSLSPHTWAPVGGSPLGISILTLAAFAMMLFLGSLIGNQELLRSVSLIRCQQMTMLEEISNPRLDERSLTLLLISAEVLSLSRFTHHWVYFTPLVPFLKVRKSSPLTTWMQQIWASVVSLGRYIAVERLFKHRR